MVIEKKEYNDDEDQEEEEDEEEKEKAIKGYYCSEEKLIIWLSFKWFRLLPN